MRFCDSIEWIPRRQTRRLFFKANNDEGRRTALVVCEHTFVTLCCVRTLRRRILWVFTQWGYQALQLSDSAYLTFVHDRLKLPKGKRSDYIAQVDTLIERFTKTAAETPDLQVKRFLKTGSLWKGTVMRPRAGNGVDADIAVFIEIEETPAALENLHQRIKDLLKKTYPTKADSDFKLQPRTLGIHFVDSDLDVDLVPIIPVVGPGDFGLQPSSQGDPLIRTSVAGQLKFIRSHKDAYNNWAALVRLIKRWRDNKEVPLRSFAIELITCFLQDRDGIPSSIDEGLSRFWLFVAQELLSTVVSFGAINGGLGVGNYDASSVVVIDPVNADNNVTRRIDSNEAGDLTEIATESWERHHEGRTAGSKAATLEQLREIFGNDFNFE